MDIETISLFPIRAVTVRLRFQQATLAPFFHQRHLMPFLKELLANKERLDNENKLWVETPESGQSTFRHSDTYRFTLFCTAEAYPLFIELLNRLRHLPDSYPERTQQKGLFDDKFVFDGLEDYFTQQSILRHQDLFQYDSAALQRELDFWQPQTQITLRFTSPTRLKYKPQGNTKNPYIHDRGKIQIGETERRVFKALKNISAEIGSNFNHLLPSYQEVSDQLFWTDNTQTQKDNKIAPFGGVMGSITLSQPQQDTPNLALLILGQYTGIGERRCYGLGRYRLENNQQKGTLPPLQKSKNYLGRCSQINTLELACYNIAQKHPYIRQYIDHTVAEFDSEIEEQLENQNTLSRNINLHDLSQRLKNGQYEAGVLQGFILRRADHHPRPLAVPPLEDRIAQRAVVETMGVDIDQLSSNYSYGFRRGQSRMNARDRILMLNRQGYKWFFEADIDEFFDLISFAEIYNRLKSFFPDEPLIPLIMDWIKAPVYFNNQLIERLSGLPQGSPISPMLANLLLEDFDTDLESAGLKMVRFADDFVILCKSQEQAEQAAQRAEHSLSELGLSFNTEKTRIGAVSDSFTFLGYTFLDGLALENSHPKSATKKLDTKTIPTASWLAKLLSKQPRMLDELNATLDKKHRDNDLSPITTTSTEQLSNVPKISSATYPQFNPCELGSTIFVTGTCKYLHQKDGCLEVLENSDQPALLIEQWNNLAHIVLFGRHNISQSCQITAMKHNVPIHYCSTTGRYLGITHNAQPTQEGSGLWLKQQQLFEVENEQLISLSYQLVEARIHNQIEVIRQRTNITEDINSNPIVALRQLIKALQKAKNRDQIRGYEGKASAIYFSTLVNWVPEEYGFKTRQKRPSPDPFNALLSLGYTVLYSHAASILRVSGLYPWCGFYHQPRGRHLALASDMMEPFRHLVERTALTMLRAGQLHEEDFYMLPDNSCRLTNKAIKVYLKQLNVRMLKPMNDKNTKTPCNIPEHMLRQSNQLIRAIRDPKQSVTFFKLK